MSSMSLPVEPESFRRSGRDRRSGQEYEIDLAPRYPSLLRAQSTTNIAYQNLDVRHKLVR